MEENNIQTNTIEENTVVPIAPKPHKNKKLFILLVVVLFTIILAAAFYLYKKNQNKTVEPVAIPTDVQVQFLEESKRVIDNAPQIPKDKKLEILKANLETQ